MATDAEVRKPSKDELLAQIDGLWAKQAESAQNRDLKGVSAAAAEIRKVQAAIDNITAEAEKTAIDEALAIAKTALEQVDMSAKGPIMASVEIGGTLTKTDTGWDDLLLFVRGDGKPANEAFHDLFPYQVLEGLETIKGVKFTISRTGVTVEPTGKAAKAPTTGKPNGNGGSNKGWVKDGVLYTLDQAYQAGATDEDKAKYATDVEPLEGKPRGNAMFAFKKKVAKREGFVLNE